MGTTNVAPPDEGTRVQFKMTFTCQDMEASRIRSALWKVCHDPSILRGEPTFLSDPGDIKKHVETPSLLDRILGHRTDESSSFTAKIVDLNPRAIPAIMELVQDPAVTSVDIDVQLSNAEMGPDTGNVLNYLRGGDLHTLERTLTEASVTRK